MRRITTHKVNDCNERLIIQAVDGPGGGGANHAYFIGGYERKDAGGDTETAVTLHFQNGPIAEVGTNGITHEVLLAILIDRLQSFQAGPYACQQNGMALSSLQDAMWWLKNRTLERVARGVEGTHTV